MAQDRRKEDLNKLLAFLQNIIREPENSWFVDELCSLLPSKKDDTKSLAKIEKYLGLDYNIDKIVPLIDFSFVKNEYLRECFKADYREMLRYRFGSRAHKIDFSEYCRYAIIIAERSINLFYCQEGDINEIKLHILRFNSSAKIDSAKSLEEIPFCVKLWSFCSEYELKSIKKIFDNVREVRNIKSHGAMVSEDDERWFQNSRESLKKDGFPLLCDGRVDWRALEKKNPDLWRKYNEEIKETSEHKRYIWLAWRREQPFEEINRRLKELVSLIATAIN